MKNLFIFLNLQFFAVLSFAQTDSARHFVLGVIDNIMSVQLSENRILNIYLPEGYNKTDSIQYPVIYLLDGSADEDFIHVAGLVQFNNFEWVNRLPKSIVVGIATVDRRRDFTFPTTVAAEKKLYPSTGYSNKFISFIEKELQPFIQKKYKGSDFKTIIGQSLGGLLATEILISKPSLFTNYIIISPSLWWDNGALLKKASDKFKNPDRSFSFAQNTGIYIAVGKEGLTPTEIPRVMEVDANVLADQLLNLINARVYFDYLPLEDHATIAHQAILNAFRLLHAAAAYK